MTANKPHTSIWADKSFDDEELRSQFPAAPKPGFDMGLGDDSPPDDQTYGRQRRVGLTAGGPGVKRAAAKAIFDGRGIKYDRMFRTARWWVAVTFE